MKKRGVSILVRCPLPLGAPPWARDCRAWREGRGPRGMAFRRKRLRALRGRVGHQRFVRDGSDDDSLFEETPEQKPAEFRPSACLSRGPGDVSPTSAVPAAPRSRQTLPDFVRRLAECADPR